MYLQSKIFYRLSLTLLLVLALSACSATPYKYTPLSNFTIIERAKTQVSGDFKVRASVPGEDEAEKLFGIPVYKRGIQPVWLEITNNSPNRARFAPYSVDKIYFSPYEVAYIHKKLFSKQGLADMEQRFNEITIPRQIPAGETVSGFIFTHASSGTKTFNVDIFYTGEDPDLENFTFFVEVPGFVPDHAEVDFKKLYTEDEIRDVDAAGLRETLMSLPCCSSDRDSSGIGQPVNIVLVASGKDLLQALLRAEWEESSYNRDEAYLAQAYYFFGRVPDAVFVNKRDKSTARNEMRLWLAPIRVDGRPVWVAQIKHAIGRRFKIGDFFMGVKPDPEADEGRNYILQNLWYSQSLKEFAWSNSGNKVSIKDPELDFKNNPWFTDGYRIVLWLSGDTISLLEAREIKWDDHPEVFQ